MARLEDLLPSAAIRGLLPEEIVTVVSVWWFGSDALELTYKTVTGRLANLLLYRDDELRFEVVEQGRPWRLDGNGAMIVRETRAKSILSVSKVYDYALNPYTGCEHACSYCYARFMKRFTGHKEPWGEFVDAKINAPDLLRLEIDRKKRGTVWVSGVCDPYQPLEAHFNLTRRCLEILAHSQWPVRVQTRSPLVLRDMDILKEAHDLEVGLSVTTADDGIRRLFEPRAPSIGDRLKALDELHKHGVRTFAMVAPILPGAEGLGELLMGKVDYLLVDRMNYDYGAWVYRKHGLEDKLTDDFFRRTAQGLSSTCRELGIACRVVFYSENARPTPVSSGLG